MRTLALAVLLGFSLVAHAAPKPPKAVKAEKAVVCFPIKTLLKDLYNKYGEEPMVVGVDGNMEEVGMALYVNRETGSYTVIEFDSEAGCILSVGRNVRYRFPKVNNML
jgi:hypothetical protein